MLERIVIRQRNSPSLGNPLDLGLLAEALIFYGEVRLIANHIVMENLLCAEPPEVILELLEQGFLKLAYETNQLLIMTENDNTPAALHQPTAGHMDVWDLPVVLRTVLHKVYGRSGKARRVANRLEKKIELVQYSENFTNEAAEDLSDEQYVEESVRTLLRTYVPEYRDSVQFRTRRNGNKLKVLTDISFPEVNRLYHRHMPATHSSLSPAYFLAHLLNVKADLQFAARFDSEIAIDDVNASIIRQHVGQLFNRLGPSRRAAEAFQEFVFDDARGIAEAVRRGSCRFTDVVAILPKAAKFKEWLRSDAPQRDVVKAYFREVIAPTWIDKLPSKVVRWFVFTGAGMGLDAIGAGGLGTVAGVGLGVIDSFLLDRLIKGWKPSQFVDDHLRKLIGGESSGPK